MRSGRSHIYHSEQMVTHLQVAEIGRLTGKKLPQRLCRNGVHEEYDTDIKSPREG